VTHFWVIELLTILTMNPPRHRSILRPTIKCYYNKQTKTIKSVQLDLAKKMVLVINFNCYLFQLPGRHWPDRQARLPSNASGYSPSTSTDYRHYRISVWLGHHHFSVRSSVFEYHINALFLLSYHRSIFIYFVVCKCIDNEFRVKKVLFFKNCSPISL